MHYHILDNRATVKHAYYGADDPEKLHCEKTDKKFPHWEVGASGVLTRYVRDILEQDGSPRNMIVAHDMGRDYRTGIFPDYKGQKQKLDENKSPVEIEQYNKLFDWAKHFYASLGVTQIGVKGVEADDVIAWLVERITAVGGTCTVYTVDADLLQLCSDSVMVKLKGVPYFGDDASYEASDTGSDPVPTKLITLFKSICGDKSDNYGGVKGMGPAKFHQLLKAFGIDGMLELEQIVKGGNTDELKSAIEESGDNNLKKLLENMAEWKLSYRLADLRSELCWKPRQRKLVKPTVSRRVPNAQKLYDLLKMVGCEDMWEDEYQGLMPAPFAVTAQNWDEVKKDIFEALASADLVAYDYESSDKEPIAEFRRASTSGDNFVDNYSQRLAGASFQFGAHLENVIYIPVDHADVENNLPVSVIHEILEFCQKRNIQMVAQNQYFEGIVSQTNLGMWLKNVRDTRIMQRYLDENEEAGLKFMSKHYLGYDQVSFAETIAAGKWWPEHHGEPAKMMCQLSLDDVFTYGTDDSLVTGHLHDLLMLLLILDEQWLQYCAVAVRPTEVLQRSYVAGVKMNWSLQKRLHQRDLKTIEEGMKDLREILVKNVTGSITAGCQSLIAAEKEYVWRHARKSAAKNEKIKPEDAEANATAKLAEWRKKVESACQYTPFREELVLPTFAFTEKQVSAAAEQVGLPEIDKLTQKGWAAYLEQVGAVGFKDDWTLTPEQRLLVETVTKALALRCDKISDLRKKAEKAYVEGSEDPTKEDQDLAAAESYFTTLGEVVQKLAKVEARSVPFGDPLNVGSPAQMQQLLYCKIGAPVRLRGKKAGKSRLLIGIDQAGPATDELAIETALELDFKPEPGEEASWEYSALKVLLKVKSATTRCSLYHDKYPMWRHRDGKVHYYITMAGTDTLRPTGSSMNVLQVSKKDKEMRSQFIPPNPDYLCVAIDYNGQEIRIMANEAKDPTMLSVYDPDDEKDLHSMTGSGIAKMGYEDFRFALLDESHEKHKFVKFIRGKKAKGVNFGMSYGAGAGTLSRNLIIPKEEAQVLLDDTFQLYDRIRPWQAEQAKFMETHGYTLTAFGTKRHANMDIFSNDSGKQSRQHRQGTNATIQGTAAQMLNYVLTQMAETEMFDRLRFDFFAPIYDEVVSWVHKDDVLQYCQEMKVIMVNSTPASHTIKQVPEFSIGCDWGQLHELGRDISPETVAKYVAISLEESKPIWEVDVHEPFDPIRKYTVVEADEDEEEEVDEMVA